MGGIRNRQSLLTTKNINYAHIVGLGGSENFPKPANIIYEWSLNIKTRLKSYLEGDENNANYNKDIDNDEYRF